MLQMQALDMLVSLLNKLSFLPEEPPKAGASSNWVQMAPCYANFQASCQTELDLTGCKIEQPETLFPLECGMHRRSSALEGELAKGLLFTFPLQAAGT